MTKALIIINMIITFLLALALNQSSVDRMEALTARIDALQLTVNVTPYEPDMTKYQIKYTK